jgi:hypothetical protein
MSTPSQRLDPVPDGLALVLPPALLELIVEQVAERLVGRERPSAEPWVGIPEAAAHLGCKPWRIHDLVCRRPLRAS